MCRTTGVGPWGDWGLKMCLRKKHCIPQGRYRRPGTVPGKSLLVPLYPWCYPFHIVKLSRFGLESCSGVDWKAMACLIAAKPTDV